MELTKKQVDYTAEHFKSAKALMPYREIIEDISNNIEFYRSLPELTFEEMLALKPEISEIPKKQYELLRMFIKYFTSENGAAQAYLSMMDILERYVMIEAPCPDGTPFFVPRNSCERLAAEGALGVMNNKNELSSGNSRVSDQLIKECDY